MDESRIASIPGTRNRISFRIDGVPMAGIHQHPTYTLIYISRHLTTNLYEVKKMFSDPVFLHPEVVINPTYIKDNKNTYYAKVTFEISVSIDIIKESIYLYRTTGITDINDINFPIEPKRIFQSENGTIKYKCGRCEKTFIKSPRCPECGQIVKL